MLWSTGFFLHFHVFSRPLCLFPPDLPPGLWNGLCLTFCVVCSECTSTTVLLSSSSGWGFVSLCNVEDRNTQRVGWLDSFSAWSNNIIACELHFQIAEAVVDYWCTYILYIKYVYHHHHICNSNKKLLCCLLFVGETGGLVVPVVELVTR